MPRIDPLPSPPGDPVRRVKAASASSARGHRLGLAVLVAAAVLAGCTQEQQNIIRRDIQNWTGTNGVLEVFAGGQLVKRFLKIDKLSTALGTTDNAARDYRFGYGVLDENLNGQIDPGEKRVYFEVSNFSTYVFFENPH